ncbi:hypothetical protein QCA50_008378 [Cerrena zonata]|uniref:Uncharacterized protein n=1 Tax=Cerrena zonata TaxID=2478898 RepID=A0AAW0GDI0_9APHY
MDLMKGEHRSLPSSQHQTLCDHCLPFACVHPGDFGVVSDILTKQICSSFSASVVNAVHYRPPSGSSMNEDTVESSPPPLSCSQFFLLATSISPGILTRLSSVLPAYRFPAIFARCRTSENLRGVALGGSVTFKLKQANPSLPLSVISDYDDKILSCHISRRNGFPKAATGS